jgi:succinate dehydrogenase / fumarate reductase, cytochrome b subunit
MPAMKKPRPGPMRLVDALQYRLPPAGIVSILHRISGVIMLAFLPLLIWMFDYSITSEVSYATFTSVFSSGAGFVPGFVFKLVVLLLIWSFLHHFIAGLRHVWMDITHSVSKEFGWQSAVFTLVLSISLTVVLGYKLFF